MPHEVKTARFSDAASVCIFAVGLYLAWYGRFSCQESIFSPQDEPIIRSNGGLHSFSTGERVPLVDFLAAELRRMRRFKFRTANDSVVVLTDVDFRRRHSVNTKTGATSAIRDTSHDDSLHFASTSTVSLPAGYWTAQPGQDQGAMAIERSLIESSLMKRLLVSRQYRAIYCPVSATASDEVASLLQPDGGDKDQELIPLSKFSVRDRERFLTSPSVFRFLFVRHPFTRIAILYNRGISSGSLDSDEYRHFMGLVRGHPLQDNEHELQKLSLQFYLTFLSRQEPGDLDELFLPQVQLCGIGTVSYDLIGRVESFDEGLQTVMKRLGLRGPVTSFQTTTDVEALSHAFSQSKIRAKAARLYSNDLQKLGYDPVEALT